MYGVFLVNAAGETIASTGIEKLDGDSALLGGFISALQIYVQQVSGNQVKSMRIGDLTMVMRRCGDKHVVTLHGLHDKEADKQNQQVVDLLNDNPDIAATEGFVGLVSNLIASDKKASRRKLW
ncbi:MAG: hypothetical protein P1Q69_09000 [Candidatus Thorarchaeota archaeon]|nr:hypothetical protein [Candidatus Thorarchaeota archaeon]